MSLTPIALVLSAGLAIAATTAAQAADPLGIWYTAEQQSKVQLAKCGDAICGTIVALKEPNDPKTGQPHIDDANADPSKRARPIIGVQVVLAMKPNGGNKWSGQVYNPEDGKTYSGNLIMTGADTLKVEGCIMGGLLCKSNDWARTN